jgi:hypothetical protein
VPRLGVLADVVQAFAHHLQDLRGHPVVQMDLAFDAHEISMP